MLLWFSSLYYSENKSKETKKMVSLFVGLQLRAFLSTLLRMWGLKNMFKFIFKDIMKVQAEVCRANNELTSTFITTSSSPPLVKQIRSAIDFREKAFYALHHLRYQDILSLCECAIRRRTWNIVLRYVIIPITVHVNTFMPRCIRVYKAFMWYVW